MYEEPKPLSDNEALNKIAETVNSINKKVGLFYWLAIILLIAYLVVSILPYVSWA